jgi:hypothetical protein
MKKAAKSRKQLRPTKSKAAKQAAEFLTAELTELQKVLSAINSAEEESKATKHEFEQTLYKTTKCAVTRVRTAQLAVRMVQIWDRQAKISQEMKDLDQELTGIAAAGRQTKQWGALVDLERVRAGADERLKDGMSAARKLLPGHQAMRQAYFPRVLSLYGSYKRIGQLRMQLEEAYNSLCEKTHFDCM